MYILMWLREMIGLKTSLWYKPQNEAFMEFFNVLKDIV